MTVAADSPCAEAIETMREKGFDQLPVATSKGRLVGLVTLGNLLSYISNGRAGPDSPVSDVMFDFRKLAETVSDPSDLGTKGKDNLVLGEDKDKAKDKRRNFVEITRDTRLSALSRFFEWNSAAVVTEKDDQGAMKAVGIVTKVDLLSWLVKQGKTNGVNGSH